MSDIYSEQELDNFHSAIQSLKLYRRAELTEQQSNKLIIKDFYNNIKQTTVGAFFIFKALEFNISHINELFKYYGDYTLLEFVKVYHEDDKKYIIIDSAEKMSDIENKEPFKNFLSHLLENKWKILFTTRDSYFDDLEYQQTPYRHPSYHKQQR